MVECEPKQLREEIQVNSATRSMDFLLLLLLLSLGVGSTAAGDLELLMSFKNSLSSPSFLPSWNPTQSPCSFVGVICDAGGRVASLALQGVVLSADFRSVSSSLLALASLEKLSLRAGNLTGSLASAGGARCGAQLAELDLSGNGLRGSVADVAAIAGACSSLKSLNLSGNTLGVDRSSSFSVGFGGLDALDLSFNKISGEKDLQWLLSGGIRQLSLAGNHLSGGIPAIFRCSSLQYLDLSSNGLSGEIPIGVFGSCRSLTFLNLSTNHFTGTPPSDLSSCSSLQTLSLSNNNFSGQLPIQTLVSMPNLKNLDLAFNAFNGSLTNSISKLASLELLDLSSNKLSGSIPSGLCQNPGLISLQELDLQNNLLTGPIPGSLSNCSSLVSLDLSLNYLTGAIPASLGSLTSLKDLIMWQNSLEGEIPNELSNIRSLENLILDYNGLTGGIPLGLSNCTNLNWISLASNHLSGPIPSWIGRLGNLAILKLGSNSFSGPIPPELGDCKSLVWLDLNNNQLNGSIPPDLAKQSGNIAVGLVTGKRYVYLRNDGSPDCRGTGSLLEFGGIRPEDLNRLPSKRLCNFTRVYMGSTQYTFNNNGSMIFLDLSFNQLEGSIPTEVGNMFYLMILNLGHNMLSGLIPLEMGNLHHVAVLDLSHNALEGPIPPSFSALSLSEIDLSNNKLNGSIPELGSLATFPPNRYENNSGLCGFPLPSCEQSKDANEDGHHQNSHRRQASLAGSVALGLLFSLFCIFGLIIIAVENRKRQKKKKDNSNNSWDIYMDSRSYSGIDYSNWRLTGTNALSLNLAAFDKPLQKLTLADLLEATNGFHNDSLIGSGGFGDVYKAELKDGSVVGVRYLMMTRLRSAQKVVRSLSSFRTSNI